MEVRLQSKNPLQERLCGMELQQTLEGHLDRVWCAEWSPEGLSSLLLTTKFESIMQLSVDHR